jgi:hypothetical protein
MSDVLKTRGINSQGYGLIAKSVMRDQTLCGGAKMLYAYICSYVGAGTTAWPGRETICHDLGIGKDSYTRYLADLRSHDYIRVEQVKGKGGRFGHNVYEIVMEPCPELPCPEKPDTAEPCTEKADTNSNSINNVVVDPPTPLHTATQEPPAAADAGAQPGPAQLADKPVNPQVTMPNDSQQTEQLAGLEEKPRHNDAAVTQIQGAIKAATGADVIPGDIHALLAKYPPEAILEKVQLMGNMGHQELRNVPGLLVYLLEDNSRHIPGRARAKAGATTQRHAGKAADKARPGRKRNAWGSGPSDEDLDHVDPSLADELRAAQQEENARAIEKAAREELDALKRKEFLKTLYAT